jgi:hypothetical protein
MPRQFGAVLRIGLSKSGLTLLYSRGLWRQKSEVVADCRLSEEEAASPELMAVKLRGLLDDARCARLPVRIILADNWVRFWLVTPPQNASRLSDCHAAAAARFQALYGEPLTNWQMTADWDARQPFLACALPHALLVSLQQVGRDCRLALLEIVPQFIAAWNRLRTDLKAGAWLGVMQGDVLSIGAISRQRLCAVRALRLTADAALDPNWLPQQLTREALRLNLPLPSEIQVCGGMPADWVMHQGASLISTRLEGDRGQGLFLPAGATLAATGIRG